MLEASDLRALSLLQQVPIFGGLREEALGVLLEQSERVALPAGQWVFRQGELGDGVYLIESGSVEVLKELPSEALRIGELGVGDCFGEVALLAMIPRTASIRSVSEVQMVRLRHEHLQRLYAYDLEQFTLLVMNMGREVCRRLKRTDELLFRYAPEAFKSDLGAG